MADNGSNSKIGDGIKADADLSWYAVYTRPRAEKLVFQRILETGIEGLFTHAKDDTPMERQEKVVEKPLLSSYIFVKTKPKLFPLVFKIFGVVKFITFESKPVPIPEKQINNLKLIVNSNAEIEVTSERFAPGDHIIVETGSLKGLTGELIETGSKKKVIVRLDKLDQNILLTIPVTFLKKLQE
ncbi:MAG: UpxY family transcription antiterminator [Marinilabiliales bacterium]|nr:UpxY family transcription antiterminator [Marinilabiliales bacterium]